MALRSFSAAGLASPASVLAVFLAGCTGDAAHWRAPLEARFRPPQLYADGASSACLTAGDGSSDRKLGAVRLRLLPGSVAIGKLEGRCVYAGLAVGEVRLLVQAPGYADLRLVLPVLPDYSDRDLDGWPDVLLFQDAASRQSFLARFTWFAEAAYTVPESDRPLEITDCASLARFAYRSALGGAPLPEAWRSALPLSVPPAPEKYRYPYTLLGANLFRVRPGGFRPEDLNDGAFAQFADAETLVRLNADFVARDTRLARPGDLLFFRQEGQAQPAHLMIFLGPSRFRNDGRDYVVYHTGPDGSRKGELRSPALDELLAHPLPAWWPTAGNPNFLGVYRWKLVRERV